MRRYLPGLLPLLLVAAGCGANNDVVAAGTPTPLASGCPPVPQAQGAASIDYVDFVHAHGRDYYAGMSAPAVTATTAELGPRAFTVACSFSAFNDATHQDPGRSRDGDAAFLPAGTPVHEVKGWPATCRLAAEVEGVVRVYLAYRTDTSTATADPCALEQKP